VLTGKRNAGRHWKDWLVSRLWPDIKQRFPEITDLSSIRDYEYEQDLKDRAIRQQHLDSIVEQATARVTEAIAGRPPPLHSHFFYGASAIHAKHLVTWYLFSTDKDWETAKENGLTSDIDKLTRSELLAGGYPRQEVELILVSFVSDETIGREVGNNYWAYFK
jgi:hypothetical protein